MKNQYLIPALLFCILVPILGFSADYARDRILVMLKESVRKSSQWAYEEGSMRHPSVDALNTKYKVKSARPMGPAAMDPKPMYRIDFEDQVDVMMVVEEYLATGIFDAVEPDYIGKSHGVLMPNDAFFGSQWGLHNDGTFSQGNVTAGADMKAPAGWDVTTGSNSVVVAVLDAGINFNHSEFLGRHWGNNGEIPGNGIDDDGNGYVDDLNGWDFANSDANPIDDEGHGTSVSGIIAANGNNNTGLAGVDWNCKIMSLKVLDDNSFGYYSWWIDAVNYAVDNGADVMNMSLGGDTYSALMENAIDYAESQNVMTVASMGNDNTGNFMYPAAMSSAFAVGSTSADDTRSNPFAGGSGGSNYGFHINVVAPGNLILSLDYQDVNAYNRLWSGTSQAAPHVSGLISLMLAVNPGMSNADIKLTLHQTSDDEVGLSSEDIQGFDQYYGHGRINAGAALQFAVAGLYNKPVSQSRYSIYPNPATTELNIVSEEKDGVHYSIRGVSGQVHQSGLVGKFPGRIDVSSLESGIYFLFVDSDQGSAVRKFMKR